MRRRILVVAVTAVALAVLLLGAPLAVAIDRSVVASERGELERAALQGAVTVSPTYRSGDPIELPAVPGGIQLGAYNPSGHRIAGTGPALLEGDVSSVKQGRLVATTSGDSLVESVPVSVGEQVIGVVRASSSRSEVRATVLRDLLALLGLALVAVAGAGTLAFWQARRLARSMGRLADVATQLGAGDFSARMAPSGVAEIDLTADALAVTASRLSDQMEREHAFAARASHQLRTPLTRLRLELEAGLDADPQADPSGLETAVRDALATADHLSQTLDDVLVLTRADSGTAPLDVEALLSECGDKWHALFATSDRPLRIVVEAPPHALASMVAVRQVLHVLVDNAYRHGAGTVTLTGRETADAVAIDVTDEGDKPVRWPQASTSGHLGLVLARGLTESQGGRLLLSQEAGVTRFTILLAAAPD